MTFRDLGRELVRLGTPEDRIRVLDVDHSASTYQLPQIEQRVRVGVYYLRPAQGVTAQEVKDLFDRSDDPAFRYKITSGIGTDHMELLTPDDYARHYFSSSNKLIHIEGSRKIAREQLEEMFDEMKVEFDSQSFPHLDDVTISGHKEGNAESATEVKLLAFDGDFRNMSRLERDISRHLSEGNLHREINVGRHLVKDTKPEIILSSTEKATAKGRNFLNTLATYLLERDGGIQTEAVRAKSETVEAPQPVAQTPPLRSFPRVQTVHRSPVEVVNHAASEFHDTLARMSGYKDLEIKVIPQGILVQFPKNVFSKIRFEQRELRELKAVHNTILGSPGLHEGWNAYHLYDKRERVLKIRFTTPDQEMQSPWSKLD
jgi:hypothetical protein